MQLVIPAAGAAIGFFAGGMTPQGAAIGWAVGSTISSVILAPDTEGPRVKDLGYTGSTYGTPIARLWGTAALSGSYIWAPDLTENKSTESAKGPSITTYTYTGSFAVIFCEGPVSGIRRLWFNDELVYDVREDNEGHVYIDKLKDKLEIYLGTATQNPAPVIEEWEGAGNVPAHRGYCYITVRDYDMADYGNKLPTSVRAEIVKDDSPANTQIEVSEPGTLFAYSDADGYMYAVRRPSGSVGPVYFEKIDTSTNEIVDVSPTYSSMNTITLTTASMDVDPDTNILYYWEWYNTGSHFEPSSVDLNTWNHIHGVYYSSGSTCEDWDSSRTDDTHGPPHPYSDPFFAAPRQVRVLTNYVGYCLSSAGNDGLVLHSKDLGCAFIWYPTDYECYDCCEDSSGNIWYVCPGEGSPNVNILGILPPTGGRYEYDINQLLGIVTPSHLMWHSPSQSMLIETGSAGYIYRVSYSPTDSPAFVIEAVSDPVGVLLTWHKRTLVSDTFWVYEGDGYSFSELNVSDLSVVRSITPGVVSGNSRIFDPLSNAIWHESGTNLAKFYLDRIPDGGQPLSTVVGEIASDLGERIDVSGLNQTVRGFLMTRSEQNRDAIRRLMQSHLFDAAEVDGEVKFIELDSGSTAVSIPEVDLAAHYYGGELPPQTNISRTQEVIFPKRSEVISYSRELEYEPTAQGAGRVISKGVGTVKLNLAEVLTDDQAAQLAEVLLHVPRIERNIHNFKISNEYLYLHPIDRVDITKGSTTHHVRITEMDWSGNIINCTAVSTDTTTYTSTATGASNNGFVPTSVNTILPTIPYLLDIPLLRNNDDHPGFYSAFTSDTVNWPGTTLYRSPDVNSIEYEQMQSATNEATAGYTVSVLADSDEIYTFDNVSTVEVRLRNGELYSSTDDQVVANGANAIAFSNGEIVQFVNVSTTNSPDDGTRTLSRLLRGRRGSEWAMDSHYLGESVVLLSYTSTYDVQTSLETNGLPFYYRSPTYGSSVTNAVAHLFTNNNVRLKPFSGINPSVSFDGSDVTITWERRTRLLVSPDYAAIPLGEETESYQIDIRADGETTVLRTLTSTTPTVTYTSEQIIDDFGSRPSYFDVDIYQMSASVGRGIPLTFSTEVAGNPFPIYTDFSEYTTDSELKDADWTAVGNTFYVEGFIRASTEATGGKWIEYESRVNSASGLSWDKSEDYDDVEVLIKIAHPSSAPSAAASPRYNDKYSGVFVRANNGLSDSSLSCYLATVDTLGNGHLWYNPAGSTTYQEIGAIATIGLDMTSSPVPTIYVRFRAIGTNLKVRWWQGGTEPSVWHKDEDHALLTTGYCGFYGRKGTTAHYYFYPDEFAVAYAGDTAAFS